MNPNSARIFLALIALFGPLQEPTITSLIQQLHGPPDVAVEAVEKLNKLWAQEPDTPEKAMRRELRAHEKELIEVLASSNSRDFRLSLAALLYNLDTPTARAAGRLMTNGDKRKRPRSRGRESFAKARH